MNQRVSVIIPAFNQAQYIADAIQSVIAQTFPHWELIVVDDGSTDNTRLVVAQFPDPRIRYIYQGNQGLSAARNRGFAESSAEYIACLDSDDVFRPDRLRLQVEHLNARPNVGAVYGSRIEIDEAGKPLRLVQAPPHVTLADLVMGFPFSPTDFAVRREWLQRVGGWDESFTFEGEDRDLWVRLVLGGCTFEGVGRAVSGRRLYTKRVLKNTEAKLAASLRATESAFADPRCPAEVRALKPVAKARMILDWSMVELMQGDMSLAWMHLEQAIHELPGLLANNGRNIISEIVHRSVRAGGEHEPALDQVFATLPEWLTQLRGYREWSVGRGYILRGTGDAMWGRTEDARAQFARAADWHAEVDKPYLRELTAHLLNYEAEFGYKAAHSALRTLAPYLRLLGGSGKVRWLTGCYAINRAFAYYHTKRFINVPKEVVRAVINDSSYLLNSGVWAILLRSIASMFRQSFVS